MTYFTGDIHGDPSTVENFCYGFCPTEDDVVILLGDVGANYYGDWRDEETKRRLSALKPTFLCIHGNHENRPENVEGYQVMVWQDGLVWRQDRYPKLLFAVDGEIYNIGGIRYIAIGGAYSVDKYYRLARGYGWWEDEQPSEYVKTFVEWQLSRNKVDVILSHTCPFKYEPREMFLSFVDQSTVDDSTERWLDKIEESTDYAAWFCGHWHTNKRVDKIHFLFNAFESEASIDMTGRPQVQSKYEGGAAAKV